MMFKRAGSLILSFLLTTMFVYQLDRSKVHAEDNQTVKSIKRIQGENRFKTSRAIAEELNNDYFENIVITSGYDFPDGLSGGTLAKKLNAPLVLAGKLGDSKEALEYISIHLKAKGNVYILGGTGVVSKDTENVLSEKGYTVTRIFGANRIETNNSIVESLNVEEGTPVFISNAYGFADALSASSIAALKGYPILLTNSDRLPSLIKSQISKIKPSTVYIVGGTGVIKSTVEDDIKSIMPSVQITRLSGENRYETSMSVFKHFNIDTKNVILASGKDFPDALSASQLAVKLNASMVLSNESNLEAQQNQFNEKNIENFYILGGAGALSSYVEDAINFNRENEINKIKEVYSKAAQAIRLMEIDEYMTLIDKNAPGYEETRSAYKELFNLLAQHDVDIIPTFDSFEILSINYKEARVKAVETDAITDNSEKTTEYKTFNAISNFRKVNGQWKFYSTEAVE